MAEMQEKLVEVKNNGKYEFSDGEKVNVTMRRSLGTKAVVLGYLIPFFIVIISLIVLLAVTKNEAVSGIVSVGLVIPYYIVLYTIRDQLKKTFEFTIEKI